MALKQLFPGSGNGGGGGDTPTEEQLEQIGGVANDAKNIANTAKATADAAAILADTAKDQADGYSAQITTAVGKADTAKAAADAASAAAATASADAAAVTAIATTASTKADTSLTAATTAGNKADAAEAVAAGMDARVTAAETKATTAKNTADAASAAVATATTKADTAKSIADAAGALAATHESRIDAVESTAVGFSTAVSEANANANSARLTADSAYSLADGLADSVENALTVANAADVKATNVQTDVATALAVATEGRTTANSNVAAIAALDTELGNAVTDMTVSVAAATAAAAAATAASNDAVNLIADATDRIDITDNDVDQLTARVVTLEEGGGGDSLPASQWLSVWGDSRTEQSWNTNRTGLTARGYPFWAESLSRRVRVHKKYNFGLSGDDIAELYARMIGNVPNDQGMHPNDVPPGPAVLLIGTNSITADLPLADLMTQLGQCITWLKEHGHMVFLVAEYPRGIGSILSTNEQKLMNSYVDSIRRLAITDKDIRVIDPWPYAADPSVNTCIPLAGMVNGDGLHPTPGFGFVIGKLLAEAFKEAGMRKVIFPGGGQGLYDSVLNPRGNLIQNPNFSVTQAAPGTGNITGVVPSNWTITLADTALSCVGSVVTVTLPDGTKKKAWRAVITGTASADYSGLQVRQGSLDATRVADGEIVEGHFEVMVQDTPVNLLSCTCNIATASSATSTFGGLTTGGSGSPNPKDLTIPPDVATGFYAVSRAPEYTHATGNTLAFECRPYFGNAGTVNVTIDFISASMKRK